MIDSFKGRYAFLSNFYSCTVFDEDGIKYNNSEAYFQSHKTLDKEKRKEFFGLSPSVAKQKGRRIELRDDWEDVKLDIMEQAVRAKFTQNDDLKIRLMATGSKQLVEGNNWGDTFWGKVIGVGENNLGKILMKVRYDLQKIYSNVVFYSPKEERHLMYTEKEKNDLIEHESYSSDSFIEVNSCNVELPKTILESNYLTIKGGELSTWNAINRITLNLDRCVLCGADLQMYEQTDENKVVCKDCQKIWKAIKEDGVLDEIKDQLLYIAEHLKTIPEANFDVKVLEGQAELLNSIK